MNRQDAGLQSFPLIRVFLCHVSGPPGHCGLVLVLCDICKQDCSPLADGEEDWSLETGLNLIWTYSPGRCFRFTGTRYDLQTHVQTQFCWTPGSGVSTETVNKNERTSGPPTEAADTLMLFWHWPAEGSAYCMTSHVAFPLKRGFKALCRSFRKHHTSLCDFSLAEFYFCRFVFFIACVLKFILYLGQHCCFL